MRSIITDILVAIVALVAIGAFAVVSVILFLALLVAEFFSWFARKIDNYLDKKASSLFDRPED